MTSYDVKFRFERIYPINNAKSKEEAIEKAKEKFKKRFDGSENIPEEEFDIIVKTFA